MIGSPKYPDGQAVRHLPNERYLGAPARVMKQDRQVLEVAGDAQEAHGYRHLKVGMSPFGT